MFIGRSVTADEKKSGLIFENFDSIKPDRKKYGIYVSVNQKVNCLIVG